MLHCFFFFFNDTATTEIYTLSLHDALPISHSPGRFIQLLSFRGGEKVRQGAASLIRWRSAGVGLVDIDFSTDGGLSFNPVAHNELNDGAFAWTASGITTRGVLRLRDASDPAVLDTSDSVFSVGVTGHDYFVNDASVAGDQYTTAAGDNANSGTTPADPMASLNALLTVYDLDPGDRIFVDRGTYALPTNVRITAQDSGVQILGPTNGSAALLDRGTGATAQYALELIP